MDTDKRQRMVFMGGTTCDTDWRLKVIAGLLKRGVLPNQIINPHLPAGVSYTSEHARQERAAKDDPRVIVLIYICLMIGTKDPQRIGPISMFEIGRYGFAEPDRTVIVFDVGGFAERSRSRMILTDLEEQFQVAFAGKRSPYYDSLDAAMNWIAAQLI